MQSRIMSRGLGSGWPERIVGTLVFGVLLLSSLAFSAVLMVLGMVSVLGLAVRAWWLSRGAVSAQRRPDGHWLIEGEYQVLER